MFFLFLEILCRQALPAEIIICKGKISNKHVFSLSVCPGSAKPGADFALLTLSGTSLQLHPALRSQPAQPAHSLCQPSPAQHLPGLPHHSPGFVKDLEGSSKCWGGRDFGVRPREGSCWLSSTSVSSPGGTVTSCLGRRPLQMFYQLFTSGFLPALRALEDGQAAVATAGQGHLGGEGAPTALRPCVGFGLCPAGSLLIPEHHQSHAGPSRPGLP